MKNIISLILTLLCLVFLAVSASVQDEIKNKTKELERLDKELQKSQKKTQELTLREGKMLEELSSLTNKITSLQEEKSRRERELATVEKELTELTGKETALGKEKEELRQLMEYIVIMSFKHYKRREFESFMPETAMKSTHELPLLQEVGAYNYYLIMRTGQVLEEVSGLVIKTKEKKEQVQLAYLNNKIAERKLTSLQKTHTATLEKVRSQKTKSAQLALELEKRKESMNELIKMLEKRIEEERIRAEKQPKPTDKKEPGKQIIAVQQGTFDKQKKKLPWPVQGTIYAQFGRQVNQRYNTFTHNDGIDILAKTFEPVIAVAQGTVIFAQQHKHVNTIIIDHGGSYFTIYANLASIAVSTGTSVTAGTKIGNVGTDVVTGLPILHFEIRKSTQALSPVEWLQ